MLFFMSCSRSALFCWHKQLHAFVINTSGYFRLNLDHPDSHNMTWMKAADATQTFCNACWREREMLQLWQPWRWGLQIHCLSTEHRKSNPGTRRKPTNRKRREEGASFRAHGVRSQRMFSSSDIKNRNNLQLQPSLKRSQSCTQTKEVLCRLWWLHMLQRFTTKTLRRGLHGWRKQVSYCWKTARTSLMLAETSLYKTDRLWSAQSSPSAGIGIRF